MCTPYIPTAKARCIICERKASIEPSVPVMLTTTTEGKPRYAHVSCLHEHTVAVVPSGKGPIYEGLTYRLLLEVATEHDTDALAAALLNCKQKAQWYRTERGFEVNLNNLKSHRVFETIAERCAKGTLTCKVYHLGTEVDTVAVSWANRNERGRWLKKSERGDAKRCAFLMLVDEVTEPIKRYSNYA